MKNIVKKIMVCVMLVVGFTLVSACGNNDNDGDNNSSANIDTSGENIIPTFESFEIVKENSENLSFEQKQSIKTTLSSNNSNNYFGENKKSIEEKIDEEIELGEKIAIDCTVEANEYIYAITKIKNPSNKTITSITINNTRYASSLFENDSTNKRIVIKLNVGTKFRIQNYTLEKIKYIDKGAKDIIINGNVQK